MRRKGLDPLGVLNVDEKLVRSTENDLQFVSMTCFQGLVADKDGVQDRFSLGA